MKNPFINLMITFTLLLSLNFTNAQIKNAVIKNLKVYGNCEMCKARIEKSINQKKEVVSKWNADTQMLTVTYDSEKTTKDILLKKIALVGHDSDTFLAPTETYNKLPGCCKYERVAKNTPIVEAKKPESASVINDNTTEKNQLSEVYTSYFELKDALVQTDVVTTSTKASQLETAIKNVKMEKLDMDVHLVWMKVLKELNEKTLKIESSKTIELQRTQFIALSKNIYELMKVSKAETPIYYQFCPMANGGKGANWLSKENAIKNPYYGSMMLTCGKTVETIK